MLSIYTCYLLICILQITNHSSTFHLPHGDVMHTTLVKETHREIEIIIHEALPAITTYGIPAINNKTNKKGVGRLRLIC